MNPEDKRHTARRTNVTQRGAHEIDEVAETQGHDTQP